MKNTPQFYPESHKDAAVFCVVDMQVYLNSKDFIIFCMGIFSLEESFEDFFPLPGIKAK